MKTIATAISVHTESGERYLFCEEDGFTEEGLIKFLREQLGDEYPWISDWDIVGLNWDSGTIDPYIVWKDLQEELDRQ